VTFPEFLLLSVALMAAFKSFPKKGLRPKKARRPLPIRGNLRRRALYLRWKPPTPEQLAYAEQCRQENLRHHSPACEALEQELRQLGIAYRREEIVFYDGDLYVIVDFWLPNLKIGVECDGQQHRFQHRYDIQKDQMVREVTGFRICRRWNAWFLAPNLRGRLIDILGCQ
jgi:very-short-patch-repair endonuclease